MPTFTYPNKPKPGDQVAVISPSAGLPALFPDVYELGLRRLRDELGLVPVEYPTTRVMGASAADRAREGRAKAWHHLTPTTLAERESYAADQREAVSRALGEYHPDALVVFDVDIGHTDPQLILPIGGTVRVDGPAREIAVHY